MARELLELDQPDGAEPLVLSRRGDIQDFKTVRKMVRDSDVPEHIVGGAVLQNHHRFGGSLAAEEISAIALGWSRVQKVLDGEESSPVLYMGDQAYAAGIAPGNVSVSFEGHDSNGDAKHLVVPTETQFTTDDWSTDVKGQPLNAYRPISVLTSGRQSDAKKFIDRRWATYQLPMPGRLVVGQEAMDAYLKAQLAREASEEYGGDIYHSFGFWESEALLSLAVTKKAGITPNLTPRAQEIAHSAGTKAVARVLATGLGIVEVEHGDLAAYTSSINRLTGIDFTAADLETIYEDLSDLAKDTEETPAIIKFLEQNGGDGEDYLRDVSAAFMKQLVAAPRVETAAA